MAKAGESKERESATTDSALSLVGASAFGYLLRFLCDALIWLLGFKWHMKIIRASTMPLPHDKSMVAIDQSTGHYVPRDHVTKPETFVFYIHGGGFCVKSETGAAVAGQLFSRNKTLSLYTASYTTLDRSDSSSKSNTIQRMRDELVSQWDAETAKYDKKKTVFVIMGDSAGGHLTCLLSLDLQKLGSLSPDRIVMISPWFDILNSEKKIRRNENRTTDWMPRSLYDSFQSEIAACDYDVQYRFRNLINRAKDANLPPFLIVTGSGEMIGEQEESERKSASPTKPPL